MAHQLLPHFFLYSRTGSQEPRRDNNSSFRVIIHGINDVLQEHQVYIHAALFLLRDIGDACKELWKTPVAKMRGVLTLTDRGYKAKPLRRVFIKKPGKKAKRPLGIPCMYDRAMQALYALALDPVSEPTADTASFGFRKGRSVQDACEYIFTVLCQKVSAQWVLEGDIKGCFDHISHDWLIENIPMDKSVLKQFLKAGFIFQDELFPTEEGTPQGGVISPILANMALDGIQKVLSDRFHTNRMGKVDLRFKNAHKVDLVRYADDFIVTAATDVH